jgi:scyllo-inositol 2-dehydrogenase (NADP+)
MLFEAHWDRFRPAIKQGWKEVPEEGTGLLNDLGPHLIDQALQLFGTPEAVTGDVAIQRAGAQVDDYFELTLHYGTARAAVGASTLVAHPRPRFALHGTEGSYVKYGLDPQEEALKAGADPLDPDFGSDPVNGQFTAAGGAREIIPTERGRYRDFYDRVADAILDDVSVPVKPEDAREVMQIIALARESARQGRRLPVQRGE